MSSQNDSQGLLRVEFQVRFRRGDHGRRQLMKGTGDPQAGPQTDELPRLTRLLALSHRWNRLIEEGVVANYTEIARMMGLSRARVTQIIDLIYLGPDIQER